MHASNTYDERMSDDHELRLVDENLEIDRARTNPNAFGVLYNRYSPGIYRICLRATGDPDLSDDLTATVFLKAFERLDQYTAQAGSSFRAWLHVLALNVVRDHWRRTNRVSNWNDDAPIIADDTPGPEEIVLHRISLDEVRAVLAELNERHRAIVELRLSGLNTHEIASVMDMTIPALKSAQTRAYKTIRKRLAPKGAQR